MTKEVPLTRGMVAFVSDCDYERVTQYKWHVKASGCDQVVYYAQSTQFGKTAMKLHRFIMQPKRGEVVDHINHNGLDCRRENMRVVSQHQNILNSRKHANSKNQFKGVYLSPWGSYRVALTTQRGFTSFGLHRGEVKAARIYDAIVRRLRGEFAVTNFPDIDPDADTLAAKLIERKGLAV